MPAPAVLPFASIKTMICGRSENAGEEAAVAKAGEVARRAASSVPTVAMIDLTETVTGRSSSPLPPAAAVAVAPTAVAIAAAALSGGTAEGPSSISANVINTSSSSSTSSFATSPRPLFAFFFPV